MNEARFRLSMAADGSPFVTTREYINEMDCPDVGPAPVTFQKTGLSLYDALAIWAEGASAGVKSVTEMLWPRMVAVYALSRMAHVAPADVPEENKFSSAVDGIYQLIGVMERDLPDDATTAAEPFFNYEYESSAAWDEDKIAAMSLIWLKSDSAVVMSYDGRKNGWAVDGWDVRMYGENNTKKIAMQSMVAWCGGR